MEEMNPQIIVEKKLHEKGNECGRNAILIEDQTRKLLIVKFEKKVVIYNPRTYEKIKSIPDGSYDYRVRRFTKDIFVTSGNYLKFFSLDPPFTKLKEIECGHSCYDILPINDDLLLVYSGSNVHMYDYNEGKMIKKFAENKSGTWLKVICPSKYNPDNFFIYTDLRAAPKILEISTKSYEVKLHSFSDQTKLYVQNQYSADFLCLDSYLNPQKEEILLCGGKGKSCILYNLQKEIVVHEIQTKSWIFSFNIIKNRYILIGTQNGVISLHRIQNNDVAITSSSIINPHNTFQTIKLAEKNLVKGWTMNITKIRIESGKKITFIVSGEYGDVYICSVNGLQFPDSIREKEWKNDTKERIEFLFSNIDDFVFSQDEKQKIFIKIKLFNFSIEYVGKCLFF